MGEEIISSTSCVTTIASPKYFLTVLYKYFTYTTEEKEKMELFALSEKLGGNLELAIKRLTVYRPSLSKLPYISGSDDWQG